jgi:hypothetical protein
VIAIGADDSGIDGIAASQLPSLDIFQFGEGEIGAGHVRVIVVTTNTLGPVRYHRTLAASLGSSLAR